MIDSYEENPKAKAALRKVPINKFYSLSKIRRALLHILFTLITLFIIIPIVLLSYHATHGGVTTKYVTDSRSCVIAFPNGEKLEGTRTYAYRYSELFGWRLYDSNTVVTETRLNIVGESVSIAGVAKENWSINIVEGERYKQLIQPADTYVVMLGKERVTAFVTDKNMCK